MLTTLISALLYVTAFSPAAAPPAEHTVQLAVTSSVTGGNVHVAVYPSAEAFAKERGAVASAVKPLANGETEVDIELPAAGRYVFAAFQDLNGNGKLDRNFLGVPTEPYGFTERPSTKWRTPAFTEVATTVGGRGAALKLNLREWREY